MSSFLESGLYKGKHLLSAKSFGLTEYTELFTKADKMREWLCKPEYRRALKKLLVKRDEPLEFEIHADPSTRTVSSSRRAIRGLGGEVTWMPVGMTAQAKGEESWSMARIIGPNCACAMVRDDKNKNAALEWADGIEHDKLSTSIWNLGCGNGEHPTQTLVDLYPPWRLLRDELLAGELVVGIVGDISGSRTIHSLLHGLSVFGATIYLIGHKKEHIPDEIMRDLDTSRLTIIRVTSQRGMLSVLHKIKILYYTRYQGNLRPNAAKAEKIKQEKEYAEEFGVTTLILTKMRADAYVLHPLPFGLEYRLLHRRGPDLIDPRRFIHIQQARDGVVLRMALLREMFAKNTDIPRLIFRQEKTKVITGGKFVFNIPNTEISTICTVNDCLNLKVLGNPWGIHCLTQEYKEKLRTWVPYAICPNCAPKRYYQRLIDMYNDLKK